jgi:hypothetical protein
MTDDPIPLDEARRRHRRRTTASTRSEPEDLGDRGRDLDDEASALDCPVVALGQRHGVYYFLSAAGEIRDMRPRDMTTLGLLSLFNGAPGWLYQHYAKLDRKGKETGEIDQIAAASALMRQCAVAGLWRVDTPKRGVGVWRDSKGAVVAHCGDHLLFFELGVRRRAAAGMHLEGAVYIASPAIAPPAAESATREQAAALLREIKTLWRFGGEH